MKLLTKEVEKKLPKLYSQEKNKDPMLIVKFFCPWNNFTWYAYEGEWQEAEDSTKEFIFFGYVVGQDNELGYFSLSQLESIRGPWGLRIERDMYFDPVRLSEVIKP